MMGAFCAGNATEQIKSTDEIAVFIFEEKTMLINDEWND